LKSSAPHNDEKEDLILLSYEKNVLQARCFVNQNALQARFIKKMRRRPDFLTES